MPQNPSFVFSSKYSMVHCKMASTVVDIWSLWITPRDVPDLLLWETSPASWTDSLQLGLQQDEVDFLYNMSMLRIVQISVLILIDPYKRREWCFKTAFDISFSLLLLRSAVKLCLSSTHTKCIPRFSEDPLCMLMCQREHMNLSPSLKDISGDNSSKQPHKTS